MQIAPNTLLKYRFMVSIHSRLIFCWNKLKPAFTEISFGIYALGSLIQIKPVALEKRLELGPFGFAELS
jgi:hypothetical protein